MQWPRGNKIPRANTFLRLVPLSSVWAFCLCYRPRTLKHSLHLFQCFPVLKSEHNSLRIEVLMRTIMGLFFFVFFSTTLKKNLTNPTISCRNSDQYCPLVQKAWPIPIYSHSKSDQFCQSHLLLKKFWLIQPAPEHFLTNPTISHRQLTSYQTIICHLHEYKDCRPLQILDAHLYTVARKLE